MNQHVEINYDGIDKNEEYEKIITKVMNECFENDYLYKLYYHQWSLTHYVQSMGGIFRIYRGGHISWIGAKDEGSGVRPTLFLKSDISIGVGDGTEVNPYQLNI